MMTDDGPQKTEVVLGLRCPRCARPLAVRTVPERPGFDCPSGHDFTPEGLLAAGDEALRRAIGQVLHVWKERAVILREMADASRGTSSAPLVAGFEKEARALETQVEVLGRALAA